MIRVPGPFHAATALLVLALAGAARVEGGDFELNVFAGASLLETRASSESIDLPIPVPLPDLPGIIPLPPLPPFRFGQQTTLGRSFLLGVRVGYGLSDRVQVEASFAAEPGRTQRTEFSVQCDVRPCPLARPVREVLVRAPTEDKVASYQYDAALLVHLLGKHTVRPFVSTGLGGFSFDAPEGLRTNFAFNVGAGLRIGSGQVTGRIDVKDFIILDHYLTGATEHDLEATGGVTVRLN